ncbi:hypothetical protein [Rhodococcoides kyotonense]|uniref:hypothetical protein n=1 Tax=Rhodococcoides kyotonense TaxID=398843 RepID=UPI001FEA4595|nr:hypothetical protein [Rhodococcus kyotonensis]
MQIEECTVDTVDRQRVHQLGEVVGPWPEETLMRVSRRRASGSRPASSAARLATDHKYAA